MADPLHPFLAALVREAGFDPARVARQIAGEAEVSRAMVEWARDRLGVPESTWPLRLSSAPAAPRLLSKRARTMENAESTHRRGRRHIRDWELTRWMKAAGYTYDRLATETKTKKGTITACANGHRSASAELRAAIERLSGGAVPASSWP